MRWRRLRTKKLKPRKMRWRRLRTRKVPKNANPRTLDASTIVEKPNVKNAVEAGSVYTSVSNACVKTVVEAVSAFMSV
jgi:hypothetical protein